MKLFPPLLVCGALALLACPLFLNAQGSLTPSGAPAATMRTLDQLGAQLDEVQRARIAVNATNTPGNGDYVYVITQPGSYYLTSDIIKSDMRTGVRITVGGVTLDLNGHSIIETTAFGCAISVGSWGGGVVVRNGTISGGAVGIAGESVAAVQVQVSDVQVYNTNGQGVYFVGEGCVATRVQVQGAKYAGISLAGSASLAVDCSVRDVTCANSITLDGIRAATVRGCSVANVVNDAYGVAGISGWTVENCTVSGVACTNTASGGMVYGINGTVVRGCTVSAIGTSGSFTDVYGIRGDSIEGCSVSSVQGKDPYGINGAMGVVRGCRVFSVNAVATPAQGSTEAYGIRAGEIQGCTVSSLTTAAAGSGIRGNSVADSVVSEVTARVPTGISGSGSVARCQVRSIVGNPGSTATYGISCDGTVGDCTVTGLYSPSPWTYGIYGSVVRGCRLNSIGTVNSGGFACGIGLWVAGLAEDNSLRDVRNVGIALSQGCVARGNALFNVGAVAGVADGKAISGLTGSRIEGNTIGGDAPDYGVFVEAGCIGSLVVGNHCVGTFSGAATNAGGVDTGAYNIPTGNRHGSIVTGSGVITAYTEGANYAN